MEVEIRKIQKIGDSHFVSVPAKVLFLWRVKYGKQPDRVKMEIHEDGTITIKPKL